MSYLVQIRTFLEAYRAGSLTKAAANLGLSQPAASAHLQALESLFEKPLFTRQARGVIPTAAAHDLARSVAEPLDALEAGLASAKARTTVLSGTVHIGGPPEYMGERCARKFADLQAQGLQVRMHLGNRDRIYALLASGEVDLAFTASSPNDRALGHTEVSRERFLLVAAPELARRLAGREVTPKVLSRFPVVAYDDELPLIRDYFREVFRSQVGSPVAAIVQDLRIVRNLVEAGAGWSVLPDYLCAERFALGTLVEIGLPGPENALNLVWVKTALRHPRVAFVRNALLAYRPAWPGEAAPSNRITDRSAELK